METVMELSALPSATNSPESAAVQLTSSIQLGEKSVGILWNEQEKLSVPTLELENAG